VTDAAAQVVGIYQRHAAAFDRLRSRALFEKGWLERFLAAMGRDPHVLDLGCGAGEPLARHLIERGCRVTGVDTSAALLQLARARFPGHRWLEGDMRRLALGERFDGILAWDSFFFLTPADQRSMFPAFAAHATPDAALLYTSGPEACVRIGRFEGEALYHASLDPGEYRRLLRDHGFEVLDYRAEDPECAGHTVWLARRRRA